MFLKNAHPLLHPKKGFYANAYKLTLEQGMQ
jgi:hypothetical protein